MTKREDVCRHLVLTEHHDTEITAAGSYTESFVSCDRCGDIFEDRREADRRAALPETKEEK